MNWENGSLFESTDKDFNCSVLALKAVGDNQLLTFPNSNLISKSKFR